ncbi:MAG: ParA family protein [Deltaproteobacteria bacterium]|nr:ParA family protein [Deltaproteobacteria bacterium]
MGCVITISNQKGGVGKTTTAVNLSASIAKSGKRVLLIDSDPQGNATTGLGFSKAALNAGLYDFLLGFAAIDSSAVQTEMAGLYLMGATKNLIGAEVELYLEDNREYLLKKRLDSIKGNYDFIIIDSPPSLGFLTINAITASNYVLVPLQCEYYALEGLSQLLDTLKAVKKGLNPDLKIVGILLTMYDSRNNLSAQVQEEVRGHFKGTVFDTVIPRNVRLSEAPSHGKPIIMYDAQSRGAQSYLKLAIEVIKRGEKNE